MLELGGLLTVGSMMLVSVFTPMFRQPSPPRWTSVALVLDLATVAITGLFAFGLALLTAGMIDLVQHGIGVVHLVLLVGVALGALALGRWILARTTPKAPASTA